MPIPVRKPYTCMICGEATQKYIPGQGAVCHTCFNEGWGRLPEKPLPNEKEADDLRVQVQELPADNGENKIHRRQKRRS